MELRPFAASDAGTVLSWCGSETAFYKWTAGVLGSYPLSVEEFGRMAERTAFTAVDGDQIVGFFTMRQPGDDPGELRFGFVTVDNRKRGMGCGKAMLQLGLEYAREVCGAKKVTLGVFDNNPAAYHCYKAVGFRDVPVTEPETYSVLGEMWKCLELEYLF